MKCSMKHDHCEMKKMKHMERGAMKMVVKEKMKKKDKKD